jgi:pimeloyl-ACP methyl ester carboxylesterase
MIEDARGHIDYAVCGAGPTIVLVPGSCSTGAVWRPVIAGWGDRFRRVTTSLLGYGSTAERRTALYPSIQHEVDGVEAVIREAGGPVHLVGHSFGGLVAGATALRNRVPLASLTVVEAPAAELLRDRGDQRYRAFRIMTEHYFAAFAGGDKEAIARMIDFYGGAGTFRVVAAARPRLCAGNDGSQHPRLGERVRLRPVRIRAGNHRRPRPCIMGRR